MENMDLDILGKNARIAAEKNIPGNIVQIS